MTHLARKEDLGLDKAMSLAKALNLRIATGPAAAQAWVAMCLGDQAAADDIVFHQLFDTSGSSTYTYLLADNNTKEAVLIGG